MGLNEGDEVIVGVEGDAIRIQTREAALDRVQRMVRERLGEGRMPSEELIAERREEARREEGGSEEGSEARARNRETAQGG